jgi:cytochrome c-type biogenesis protein CcmF
MVQERRSMLRVWNVMLVIITFFLTIFATFMTRSGIVQSVHAFGEDRTLAWLFTGFMVVILTFSISLVIYRLPLLKARNELDSWVSREAAFLVNNWILLFSAMFILFGTMFPTLSEAVTGQRLTVAAPFFNKWMLPVGLILLVLTGVGPLLAWRKSTAKNLVDSFMWPTLSAVVTAGAMFALHIPFWASGLCFMLCAFVTGTLVQEFWRGGAIRRKNTGTDMLTALIGLVGRNKRRYGGYIVHLAIVLICLGFAGNGFMKTRAFVLEVGKETTIGRYTLRNTAVKVSDDGQKQMVTGHIAVFVDGKQIDMAYPAKWFFRRHEQEPTTEVAIRRTLAEDLYIVLGGYDAATQSATLEVHVNPLVNWIWLGFGVLALGTGIALLPERAYSFALAKMPAEMATTAGLLLACVIFGFGATTLSAQAGMPAASASTQTSFFARTPLEAQLQKEIVCTCGACGHASIGECRKDPCGDSHELRKEVAALIDQGKTHDEIIRAVIASHGGSQDMLGAPLDEGFSRLAWLFPYLLGGSGAVMVGFAAVKWSRATPTSTDAPAATDSEIEERIDDELRDLD